MRRAGVHLLRRRDLLSGVLEPWRPLASDMVDLAVCSFTLLQ